MKWFIELEEKIRIAITAVAWGLFVIVALIINSATKGNTDGMSGGQTFIIVLFLAVAIVFTVLTARTHDKEKKAAQAQAEADAKKREQEKLAEKSHEKLDDIIENGDGISIGDYSEFSATPSKIVKLIKNGNDDMQSSISYCNVGDDCTIEFDYEKCLYMCLCDGLEVGYFPDEIIEDMAGRGKFAIKVNDITINSNDKYVIKVGIHFPSDFSDTSANKNIINFPINTKVRGVTFNGRQAFLSESKDGDTLLIKHAPTVEYPDTIEVINERTGKQLGNIGADLAASLLEQFGKGCAFYGIIQEITGGEGDKITLGCNFTIEGLL